MTNGLRSIQWPLTAEKAAAVCLWMWSVKNKWFGPMVIYMNAQAKVKQNWDVDLIPYLILDLQAFLEKVAGSVEIALKMNLCKFSMLISVTENVSHFLIQSCLSPFLLQHDVAGRKRRARLHIKCLWKISFLLLYLFCICICLIHFYVTEFRALQCYQKRLDILKIKTKFRR